MVFQFEDQAFKEILSVTITAIVSGVVTLIGIWLKRNGLPGFQKAQEHKKVNFLDHYFFFSAAPSALERVEKVQLIDPVRTAMFKDMLRIHILETISFLKDFVQKDIDVEKDANPFFAELVRGWTLATKSSHEKWKAEGILDTAIDLFCGWRDPRDIMLKTDLAMISFSVFYETQEQKKAAVLDKYVSHLVSSVVDIEKSFRSMNGSISGRKYKGVIIPPIPADKHFVLSVDEHEPCENQCKTLYAPKEITDSAKSFLIE